MERIRAVLAYLLSFRRRINNWRFEDYPVRVRKQRTDDPESAVLEYCAQIINWWTLTGVGNSPETATGDLRQNFAKYKQDNVTIPRPGCHVPIQFADTTVVESNPEIYGRFIVEVLGFGPEDPVFISDQSSLGDFDGVNGGVNLVERVREVFGVDVSDITDGNLASIFKRIGSAT
jgi:hypothetical protein